MGTQAIYSWMPSVARVVAIDGFGIWPRGTPFCSPAQLTWPPKDPDDTLDFVIDIAGAIAGNEGDAIMTLDVIIRPDNAGDLTVVSSTADGTLAILWLTAGFAGTTYQVTATIGTNSGRVIARTINLPVLALATPVGLAGDLTDQTGAPITDQTDAPILVTD
jgi:hypothetical protein